MIKAIVTDVDGVIIGNKHGFNFPLPSTGVMEAFAQLKAKEMPVVFCTGKASYAINNLIQETGFNNPHIGDGGPLIFNPIESKIIKKHTLGSKLTKEIVTAFLLKNIHVSINTATDTIVDKTHNSSITEKRKGVLEKDLAVTDSLIDHTESVEVLKVTLTLQSEDEVEVARKILDLFKDKVHFIWTHHPMTGDWTYAVITAKGVSKLTASQEVASILGIDMNDILGIGDTLGDWIFMKECGYAASVGDRSPELQENVKTKGQGNFFVAPSVDENGMVAILKKFDLI